VDQSYATGAVSGSAAFSGGLVGASSDEENCYATGAVTGSIVGGLAGVGGGHIGSAYSTGQVSGADLTGGFIGFDENKTVGNSYWDLETSGVGDPSQGAGDPPNDPGITGLTSAQFQSGLPAGFDPSIWVEDPAINGGFPYLRALPPN
jgi:hypothetical protein